MLGRLLAVTLGLYRSLSDEGEVVPTLIWATAIDDLVGVRLIDGELGEEIFPTDPLGVKSPFPPCALVPVMLQYD